MSHRETASVFYALTLFGMCGLFGVGRRIRAGRLFLFLLFAALLSVPAVSMLGCGVSPKNASTTETSSTTPLSTTKVTITATAGAIQQTTSFVLTVQETK
jgi:hypothetical protein